MRDKVLDLLKNSTKALDLLEISNNLNLDSVSEMTSLMDTLNSLEEELKVYKTKKDKYILFENSHLLIGKIHINKKGFGFVTVENYEDDFYIDEKNINYALNNDIVVIEEIKSSGKKDEARVVKVLKKENNIVIGEYMLKNNKPYFKLDDSKLKMDIILDKEDIDKLMPGNKVQVYIDKELGKNKYLGKIKRIIGHKNDPGVDILSIVYKYDINDTFSDKVMEEVNDIPTSVLEEDKVNRNDLTNEKIFTIDGDDTKDIDDAVSISKKGDNYILGVHIADVSYYVKEGTELYKEALDRGTSVYLVDRVIPMLPHKLSNGICSLNPNEERLAVSCVMEINPKGKVVDYDIFPSIIKSRKQMTYNNVNKVLDGNAPEDYKEFEDDLKLMFELSTILRNDKLSRGYLDFDAKEAKIICDEKGKPIEIKLRERGKGENLIEDFMIIANETVASHLYNLEYPSIYRVHELPDDKKINEFINALALLGIDIKGDRNYSNPLKLKKILDVLRDREDFDVLSNLLLRSLRKAEYKAENLGHYGLASKCYTHFTSPIRRFPDTTVHKLLREYLFNEPNPNKLNELIDKYNTVLPSIAEHSSLKERNAIECERDVDDMKMAEYMEGHVGEVFDGIIDSIMNFGMFVELDNTIEGLVSLQSLKDDYYIFNDSNNTLVGKNRGKIYKIGDKVKVKLIMASKENSMIDFEIVEGDKNGNTK